MIIGTDADGGSLPEAFDRALMTDAELAAGIAGWQGRTDGWDQWLGPRRTGPRTRSHRREQEQCRSRRTSKRQ